MCHYKSGVIYMNGPGVYRTEIDNIDVLTKFYFGDGTNSLIHVQKYVDVISYRQFTFTRENNTIYSSILDLSDVNCTNTGYNGCDFDTWIGKCPGRDPAKTPIIFIPEEVACNFSGRSDIIYKTVGCEGLLHELGHKTFSLGHSAALCDAFDATKLCNPTDCCTDFTRQINTVGDWTCLMGYGPGLFFNVAIAYTALHIVTPLDVLKRGSQSGGTYVIPALQFTGEKNHLQVDFGNGLVYFVSYHRKNGTDFMNGLFDLRGVEGGTKLDDMVYVHKMDPAYSTMASILCKQIMPGRTWTFEGGKLAVTCVSSSGKDATVTLRLT